MGIPLTLFNPLFKERIVPTNKISVPFFLILDLILDMYVQKVHYYDKSTPPVTCNLMMKVVCRVITRNKEN